MLQIQFVNRLLPVGEIEFNGQFVQVLDPVAPTTAEYELATHSMHVLDEEASIVVEYLPAPQSIQELASVAPVVVRYLPAPQSVHVAVPVTVLYFPASHAKHVPPLGPVNPRLQTQLVSAVDPVIDCVLEGHVRQALSAIAPVVVRYLPAPQLMHATEPVLALYFPASHAKHVPPLGPVNPRLQTQLVNAVDPAIDLSLIHI